MSSSEFDNPKRWQPPLRKNEPGSQYAAGIRNPKILLFFGTVLSQWSHIEDKMIWLLEWLIYVDVEGRKHISAKSNGHTPGSQIFRSIPNHGTRIKLMKTLLKKFIGNANKSRLYDEILDSFGSLGARRNNYAHAKWWTDENGRVYMQQQQMDIFDFSTKEEVTEEEFVQFTKDVELLDDKIRQLVDVEVQIYADSLGLSRQNAPEEPSAGAE